MAISKSQLQNSFSIAEARHDLAALVHRLDASGRLQLTRRGKPVAVLLSQSEYERLTGPKVGFWEVYEKFRADAKLDQLDIDPTLFATRDKSPGREFNW